MSKYLAVDIGGTFVKYAKIDKSGNILEGNKIETPNNLKELKSLLKKLIENMGTQIKGVGISCPGQVDVKSGIVYKGGALPFLHEFAIVKFIEDSFNIPCSVINDGKAAALSELWLGNLKDTNNGAAIVLGTGVGGGIIIDGNILQGFNFQAGELGFMPRNINGGEFDNYLGYSASAVMFIRKASALLELSDLSNGEVVFDIIESNTNSVLQNMFEEYCKEIVHIIFNLQAVLDVERIVIGGGISTRKILIEQINYQYNAIRKQSIVVSSSLKPLEILPCHFGSNANLIGAIYALFTTFEGN